MTEDATNLVLEHLRHIRGRIDALTDDMRQVILRLGSARTASGGVQIFSDVNQNSEIDRIKEGLDRLER